MKPKIEEELHCQEELRVLERVDTTEWAAPVVPVIKLIGAIRLYGDYKVSVNPQFRSKQVPPTTSRRDINFTALNGGEKLYKIRSIFANST